MTLEIEIKRDKFINVDDYIEEFKSFLDLTELRLSKDLLTSCEALLNYARRSNSEYHKKGAIIRAVKKKLKLESPNIKGLIDALAKKKIYFNTLEKNRLADFYCNSNHSGLILFLEKRELDLEEINELLNQHCFLTDEETIDLFHEQCDNPINKRTKKVDLSLKKPMLESIFSSYFYESFNESVIHCFNSGVDIDDYIDDFWEHLHKNNSDQFSREHALTYLDLTSYNNLPKKYDELRNFLASLVKDAYYKQNNHTYLFIKIPRYIEDKWTLAGDITLFAEKFIEHEVKVGYFKPKKISEVTSSGLGIELKEELFSKLNEGFQYKDCFVLYDDNGNVEPDLLLSFKLDKRDESKIPCPKCRSLLVQGNSYPSFGIKSWECKNPLCEDRSMSNRGKRYSFESMLKQRSIEIPEAQIPKSLLSRWKRDVLYNVSPGEEVEYILRCYSLPNDNVYFLSKSPDTPSFGRTISKINVDKNSSQSVCWNEFKSCDFFKRWNYLVGFRDKQDMKTVSKELTFDKSKILVGDSEETLRTVIENSVDMAVTSPPYYNAREYSQYENIYIYLVKMANIAREVYYSLKPGGCFVYNIFDYFDNENIVATSNMGQKRMILSSYIQFAFRTIGFEYVGNIPWDKGEIEGNRAYNSGNNTPYYQSPLNCWEHIMIFRKPGSEIYYEWPSVLKCKPVHKMVKGVNTFGHTAPYPIEVPDLVSRILPKGSIILDPFSGSGTTGLSAVKFGHDFILCEAMEEYAELTMKRLGF